MFSSKVLCKNKKEKSLKIKHLKICYKVLDVSFHHLKMIWDNYQKTKMNIFSDWSLQLLRTCLMCLGMFHNPFPVCCMSSSALVFTLMLKVAALIIPIILPCLNWWAPMHKSNHKHLIILSFESYIAFFKLKDKIEFQRQHAITVKLHLTV